MKSPIEIFASISNAVYQFIVTLLVALILGVLFSFGLYQASLTPDKVSGIHDDSKVKSLIDKKITHAQYEELFNLSFSCFYDASKYLPIIYQSEYDEIKAWCADNSTY